MCKSLKSLLEKPIYVNEHFISSVDHLTLPGAILGSLGANGVGKSSST